MTRVAQRKQGVASAIGAIALVVALLAVVTTLVADHAGAQGRRRPRRDRVAATVGGEEGGDRVKVLRFSGFDISGRLKSPQLLYFLQRTRAELDRPRLPHRSFMPELRRSARERTH